MKIKSLSSLWFMPVLLIAGILVQIIFRYSYGSKLFYLKAGIVMLLCFAVGFLIPHIEPYGWPLGMDIGLVAAGFMLAGHFIGLLTSYIRQSEYFVFANFIISLFVLLIISCHLLPPGDVSMHRGSYGNIWIFLINSFIESYFAISIAMMIDLIPHFSKIFSYIGQNTFGILVLHKPMVAYMSTYAAQVGCSADVLATALLISCIGMLLSLLISAGIKRVAPVLLGE